MRFQVVAALESLGDRDYQERSWGRVEDGVNFYDDLTLNVHILYDDCLVLPDPAEAVPSVLYGSEVPALLELENALGPMIAQLGDAPDDVYLADPRWGTVVGAAHKALTVMQMSDAGKRGT